jgi:hypothetical protein
MSMTIADIRRNVRDWDEAPFIVPVQHWSPSSLSSPMRCPEMFRQSYILKVKSKPRVSMVLGTANHSTHERTFERQIAGHETPLAEAIEFYRDEAWPNAVKRDGGPDNIREWNDDTPDFGISRGSLMVTAYHMNVVPRVEASAVEAEYRLPVEGVPVPLFGKVDSYRRAGDRREDILPGAHPQPGMALQGQSTSCSPTGRSTGTWSRRRKSRRRLRRCRSPACSRRSCLRSRSRRRSRRRPSAMANLLMHSTGLTTRGRRPGSCTKCAAGVATAHLCCLKGVSRMTVAELLPGRRRGWTVIALPDYRIVRRRGERCAPLPKPPRRPKAASWDRRRR